LGFSIILFSCSKNYDNPVNSDTGQQDNLSPPNYELSMKVYQVTTERCYLLLDTTFCTNKNIEYIPGTNYFATKDGSYSTFTVVFKFLWRINNGSDQTGHFIIYETGIDNGLYVHGNTPGQDSIILHPTLSNHHIYKWTMGTDIIVGNKE
jgi:hypothetical protein